jgi:hypothetical protein
MRHVRCLSGVRGERYFLHEGWDSLQDYKQYDSLYRLSKRLGFKKAKEVWNLNPVVESSVNPSDFRLVKMNPSGKGRY